MTHLLNYVINVIIKRIEMFYEKKDKTPEENLAIAKIQVMFEDAFWYI